MTSRILLLGALLAALGPMPTAAQLLGDSASAEKCAAAIAGDVAGDVLVHCGMSREEIDALVGRLVVVLDQRAALREAEAAGVTRFAIIALAQRVVVDRTVETVDQALIELERAVEVAVDVQRETPGSAEAGDFVETVVARVAELSAEGRFDEAAAEADRAFKRWEAEEERRRQAALGEGVRLLEAGLRQDLLRRDAASAARRIEKRVALQVTEPAALFGALRKEQDKWYVWGRDKGVNLDLEVSIELARLCLDRARLVEDRSDALTDLAVSLATLGERESDTARLQQAVAAFRAALERWPRDAAPLEWAAAQNNLGNSLATLGQRESGTDRLEEAVAAFRAALQERTRERSPHHWAQTQNNLGAALQTLGQRESGTALLEESVAAFRAAMQEWTRQRVPYEWAMTQNNLGAALVALGERESGTARLREAVAAFRAALEGWTRERVPLGWAGTQNNLGSTLLRLGQREGRTELLEEAVSA